MFGSVEVLKEISRGLSHHDLNLRCITASLEFAPTGLFNQRTHGFPVLKIPTYPRAVHPRTLPEAGIGTSGHYTVVNGQENQMDVDYNIDLQLEYWQVACNNVYK